VDLASSEASTSKPDVYTIRQLNQQTAHVIGRVEEYGPALITKYGRFVAMISPLKGEIESRVIEEIAQEVGKRGPGPSLQVSEGSPAVYSLHQVGRKTVQVLEEIQKSGPALITRNGHFVAMISPLKGEIESRVITELARDVGKQG
jgi:antitoxin (DNA-binding transcriptional repressor) of toxin-antitoxin stability system